MRSNGDNSNIINYIMPFPSDCQSVALHFEHCCNFNAGEILKAALVRMSLKTAYDH